MPRVLVYLWALPTTCLGLLLLPTVLFGGGRARVVQGVIEIHGGWIEYLLTHWVPVAGGAAALTLGHVIIGRDEESLNQSRSHEHVHVRQCERWGPLFIPAYLLASVMIWIRGGDAYRDNPFEREAYAME